MVENDKPAAGQPTIIPSTPEITPERRHTGGSGGNIPATQLGDIFSAEVTGEVEHVESTIEEMQAIMDGLDFTRFPGCKTEMEIITEPPAQSQSSTKRAIHRATPMAPSTQAKATDNSFWIHSTPKALTTQGSPPRIDKGKRKKVQPPPIPHLSSSQHPSHEPKSQIQTSELGVSGSPLRRIASKRTFARRKLTETPQKGAQELPGSYLPPMDPGEEVAPAPKRTRAKGGRKSGKN